MAEQEPPEYYEDNLPMPDLRQFGRDANANVNKPVRFLEMRDGSVIDDLDPPTNDKKDLRIMKGLTPFRRRMRKSITYGLASLATAATVGIVPAYVSGAFDNSVAQSSVEASIPLEKVSNQAVKIFAENFSTIIVEEAQNNGIEKDGLNPGSGSSQFDAPSLIGGENAHYSLSYMLQKNSDGSTNWKNLQSSGISASTDGQQVNRFTLIHTIDQENGSDFWTIQVMRISSSGLEIITSYTNDPTLTRDTTITPPSESKVYSDQTKVLTADRLKTLIGNGRQFFASVKENTPISIINYNAEG